MVSTVVWKNDRKEVHLLIVEDWEPPCRGLKSCFIVENSSLVFPGPDCMS